MDDLSNGNSAVAAEGNPSGDPSASSNGTVNQNGEARQGATAQDTFIPEGIDLNTLPPNVRAYVDKINKDMVRGFTEKTTKLSETTKSEVEKATQAYREKASFYDQIATQEEFVKQWNDYVQKAQASGQPVQEGDPVLSQMKQQLQEMNQKIQLSEMTQVTEAFADAVNEKGDKLHPEFDQLNNISLGKIGNGEDFSLLRAGIELAQGNSPQEKLANGYKMAKAAYDSIFNEGKKAGMGRLQMKVQNGTQPPANSAGDTLTVTEKKPKSAREALEMAKRGMVVSRD